MPPVARPATVDRTLGIVANEVMRELWTNRAGPAWCANHDIFKAVYEPVSSAVITAAEPLAGRVVLDVGCGTGGLSRLVADRGGTPVGADISSTMIDGARRLHPELRFEVVDVQVGDLAATRAGWLRPSDLGVRSDVLRRPGRRLRQHRRRGAAAGDDGVRLLAVAGRERDVLARHPPAGRAHAGPATAGEPVRTGPGGVR